MMRLFPSLAASAAPAVGPLPADPLGSPMWTYHAGKLFAGAPVVFDPAVKVDLPMLAENQHVLPVTIDARALGAVRRMVLFADLNPIPIAVEYEPLAAHAYLATRIKLDQRTPVRGAVLTADGVWHVAGGWVDAAGGGCSAPPVSRVRGDWADHLGELRGAAWPQGDATRVRIAIRHPMDTGLVENIPAYNIEEVTFAAEDGTPLARMTVHGSVSEDPVFTVLLSPAGGGPVAVNARDIGGLVVTGAVAPRSGAALAAAVRR